MFLYWAYKKNIIEYKISEQGLKLLVICNFINFGYSVYHVAYEYSKVEENQKAFKKMLAYSKINIAGEV